MLPASHAHPLSPPRDSPHAASSSLPDLPAVLLDPPFLPIDLPNSTKPLFPASPPKHDDADLLVSDANRGGSGAPIGGINGKAAQGQGIGLGLPSVLSTTPLSPDLVDPPSLLPTHLSLAAAPHLLPPSSLASLPLVHLIALAQSLSRDLSTTQAELLNRTHELEAVEQLALDKGAGKGELDRAKVRARAEEREKEEIPEGGKNRKGTEREQEKKEWRIDLMGAREQTVEEKVGTEVDLDLEDLTEAISSNAFDLVPSPPSQPDDTLIRQRALSLPPPVPTNDSDAASVSSLPVPTSPTSAALAAPTAPKPLSLKPARARHASLSARIFGSLGGSAILSSSPSSSSVPPASPTLAHSPSASSLAVPSSDAPAFPSATSTNAAVSIPRRHNRSGSIRSVSSVRSTASKASDAGSEASRKTGYSEWLGWRVWGGTGRGNAPLKAATEPDEVRSLSAKTDEEDRLTQDEEGAVLNTRTEEPDTPVPNRTLDLFGTSSSSSAEASTPTSKRDHGFSDTSGPSSPTGRAATTSSPPPSSSAMSTSSRRTSTTRSTLATTFADSPSSLSSALSPPSHTTPDTKRSAPSTEPPDSPTMSRTRSPGPPPFLTRQQSIASPALSTPMTTSTLSTPSLASPNRLLSSEQSSRSSSRRASTTLELPRAEHGQPSHFSAIAQAADQLSPSSEGGDALDAVLSKRATREEGSLVSSLAGGLLENVVAAGPPTEAENGERNAADEGEGTIKARSNAAVHPTFVPGVPLYSAPHDVLAAKTAEQGYVAAAKGTLGRALGFGASASTSSTNSSSSTSQSPSDGVRRAVQDLAVFPRLPSISLSRQSLFAQSTLSTPETHVSFSSSLPPVVPHATTFALAAPSGTPTTMELDIISAEAPPPSLALLKPTSAAKRDQENPSAAAEEDDGPLIDRFGFIYDVHSGMELLKESRRREQEKERDKGMTREKKSSKEAVVEPTGVASPIQAEGNPQLDALSESIGLTPTTEAPNSLSPPSESPADDPPSSLLAPFSATAPNSSTPATSPLLRPQKLVRAPSSNDSTASPAPGGPQSMRALLAQLRSMTDAVEKTQQEAWDAFIRKRQAKLARLGEEATGKGKKRPKSVFAEEEDDRVEAREESWTENLVGVAQMGTEGKSRKEDWNEFKELVRRGIPITYRPKIWGECSSANEAREPGVYQELLASPREDEQPCLKQIDMDCHRTFPTNVFFAGNGPGVAKLRNVLVAYSRRNPRIGYCQGMNNLVATLLLTHPAEEDAFWVLVCIIENILPSDYYTSHLLVSRADQQVLHDLVDRILPSIAAHLDEHGVELSAISFGWFLSLFTDVLPIQTLLRVWDLFFIHGTVLLFRIALAILKLHEADLLACDSAAGLYGLLGSLPGHLYHADKLLKVACEDLASSVKDRDVSLLRNKHVAVLQEELGMSAHEAPEY
ncbi:hypothetical protein JCM1841_002598 [Sporobolomyces salmonicolor]